VGDQAEAVDGTERGGLEPTPNNECRDIDAAAD
jgi:hypothetical protein